MSLTCPVCLSKYKTQVPHCNKCQWDGTPFKQQVLLGGNVQNLVQQEQKRLTQFKKTYQAKTQQHDVQSDMDLWDEISEVNTLLAYQNYLQQFPKGLFSSQAQRIIDLKTVFQQKIEGLAALKKEAENREQTSTIIEIESPPKVTLPTDSNKRLITVSNSGNADFSDIQEAIDYSEDGDTILIKAGNYFISVPFNLEGKKNLSIIGEIVGKNRTSLQFNGEMLVLSEEEQKNSNSWKYKENIDSTEDDLVFVLKNIVFLSTSDKRFITLIKGTLILRNCEFQGNQLLYLVNVFCEVQDCTFVNMGGKYSVLFVIGNNVECTIKNSIFKEIKNDIYYRECCFLAVHGGYAYIEGTEFMTHSNSYNSDERYIRLGGANSATTFKDCEFSFSINNSNREQVIFANCQFQ